MSGPGPAVQGADQILHGLLPGGPAGAHPDGGVVRVGLGPEGKEELLFQRVQQGVGEDGVLLVGVGVEEHGIAPRLKGPAEGQGVFVRLTGQVEIQAVLQHGAELHPQQPPLGQQAAPLLDVVAEIPFQVRVGQDQGLAEQHPLLGAADGKGVAPPGQVRQGHVAGGAHEAVAQPGPVDVQQQAQLLAGLPQVGQRCQGVEGPVLRGLREVDHRRLDHVFPGLILPVGLVDPAHVLGGECSVLAGHRQHLVAGGLDGPALVDVDVAADGGDDPLMGPQGGGDDRGVGLGAAHQEVDVGLGGLAQGSDQQRTKSI